MTVDRAWRYLPGAMTAHDVALNGWTANVSRCGKRRAGWLGDERVGILPRCRTCVAREVKS